MKWQFFWLTFAFVFCFAPRAKSQNIPKIAPKELPPATSTQNDTSVSNPENSILDPGAEGPSEEIADEAGERPAPMTGARARRDQSTVVVLGSFVPVDLLIPSKVGGTIGWISSADQTLEFEYLVGSIQAPFVVGDIGSMTDTRMSLIRRTYNDRNSFNFFAGVTYFMFDIHVGNDILSRLNVATFPDLDLISQRAVGVVIGLGNRWTFDRNITLGIDWFSWSQPIWVTQRENQILNYMSNQKDRDAVNDAIEVISYLPRLSFLKVQLGIGF